MQQKSLTWNYVLFAVLAALILIGSTYLQSWLSPPRQPKPAQVKLPDPRLWADLPAMAPASSLTPALPGLGNATQLAADLAIAQWLAGERAPKQITQKPKPLPPPPEKVAARPQARHEELDLGDKDSNLKVHLTSRGAGVLSLVLKKFKAADRLGQPTDSELELIPAEHNHPWASHLLFLYDKPDDDRPFDTLGKVEWTVESKPKAGEDKQEVVFSYDVPGKDIRIRKTYSFEPGAYHLGLKVEIQRRGLSQEPLKVRYQLTSGHGLPIEGVWYTSTYTNALVGRVGERNNFWRDYQDSRTIGHKDGGEAIPKGETRIRYAGVALQYFASVIVVDDQQEKQDFLAWARPTVEAKPDPKKPYLDDITMRVITEPLDLKPGEPIVHKYLLYNGPVKVHLLAHKLGESQPVPDPLVERYEHALHLNTLTDYQSPGFFGDIAGTIGWSFLLIKVTNFMHGLLYWLHTYTYLNYGICIMLLTILVRGIMHPISRKQARNSIKMQALMPELKKINEKHKTDLQARQQGTMELYRKHGMGPLGPAGGCWIVFLQMPIFMGLYYALQESIHFRLAPFLLWTKNLAAPDMLIWWGENIPWISRPEVQGGFLYLGPYFNLLPVLAVTFMVIQQKFLMPPPTDEQQEMQHKMMKYMMIFMGVMFYKVAAGLCVYFIVSSVWGLAERKLMLPKAKPDQGVPAVPATTAAPKPRVKSSKNGQANGALKKVRDMWAELLKQAKKK